MPPTRRLLYLTHRVPFPPDKGDRIRTYHTLRCLAKHYRVHLACLADEPVPPDTQTILDQLCERVAIVPVQRRRWLRAGWALATGGSASLGAFRSRALERTLGEWTEKTTFEATLASASSMAPYLRSPALRDVPALVDLVDVDSEKWFDYAAKALPPKQWLYRREGTTLRRYEQALSTWAHAVLLVSEAETDLFRQIAPQAPVYTVTNGVDLQYYQPTAHEPRPDSCIFVGAMDYRPNVDAVGWFAAHIWPRIREQRPEATFQIVGRRPTPVVLALGAQPGIEVVGQVPDVRPYVHEAAVVVAPLRIARGLQNKVLEAMAMAKPIVASPAALAGLTPHAVSPALCADNESAWVDHVTQLFANAARRDRLSQQGRLYVERHFAWDRCLEPLLDILGTIPTRNPTSTLARTSTPTLHKV